MRFGMVMTAIMLSGAATAQSDERDAHNALMVTRHYPAASLARGEEGVVGFRVVLEKTGRIRNCAVTRSSGYVALDTATCDLMIDTARFKAVTDDNGRHGPSTHDGELLWQLPAGTPRPDVAPPRTRTIATDEIVCRHQPRPDSNYIMMKVCLSNADWGRTRNYARALTNWYQGNGYAP